MISDSVLEEVTDVDEWLDGPDSKLGFGEIGITSGINPRIREPGIMTSYISSRSETTSEVEIIKSKHIFVGMSVKDAYTYGCLLTSFVKSHAISS